MPLTIQKKLSDLKKMYEEKPTNNKANILIYSQMGAGKTVSCGTAPGPILVHSFDPGGTKSLTDQIKAGRVFVDTRFEEENSSSPSVYNLWREEVNKWTNSKLFNEIGTYVIDSGTMWLQAMMNAVMAADGRRDEPPQLQDYNKQQVITTNWLKKLTAIPCNFILTGHIDSYKDETDGRVHTSLLASGKARVKIPLMFDEVYIIRIKEATKDGNLVVTRSFVTSSNSKSQCRTRIGKDIFDTEEEMNIAAMLKKAGYPHADKPVEL